MKSFPANLPLRRAFVVMDTLLSILAISILLMLVTMAVVKQARATRELAASREALRACEETLARLQARMPPPADAVQATDLPAPAPDGLKWVQVTATRQGHHATLTGLVPGGAQ